MEHKKAKKAKKMAEEAMRMMALEEQMFLAQYLPAAGLSQLPVGQPPLESEKGKK